MANLTNVPDSGEAMDDPANFGKDVAKYGLTFGVAGAAALAGWNYVAQPSFNALRNGVATVQNAANEADSTGDIGVEF